MGKCSEILFNCVSCFNDIPCILIALLDTIVCPSSYTTFFNEIQLKDSDAIGLDSGQTKDGTPTRFLGTSCAVGNVAAVAAILVQVISEKAGDRRRLQKERSKSPKKAKKHPPVNDLALPFSVYQALEDTAIDMDEPGYDFYTGYGFVNALAAVEKIVEGGEAGSNVIFDDFLDPVLSFF